MSFRSQRRDWRKLLLSGAAIAALTAGAIGTGGVAQAAGERPCDIYANGGTECVAAHSMTRALFSNYSGRLYQVQRWSDGAMTDIGTLEAGGYANAGWQDTFCSGTSCTVTDIYDQTWRGNDLWIEGPGQIGGQDHGANAAALPVTAGGHQVYGLYVSAGVGYRDNSTSGVATGSSPEGMYMVTSGTHVNNRCCFDYGNAETNNNNTGDGHMDAINFGTEAWFAGSGSGPWVQADLENGLFAGGNGSWSANTGRSSTFVTAMLKNNGTDTYAIKDGDANWGGLATRYDGGLPTQGNYRPMHLEGSILLGTGGDNSNGSVGSFFEGVMTAGYPTDAAENSVQDNIVSVGYGTNSSFPADGATYALTNVDNGKVLDAVNCGTGDGTLVDEWSWLNQGCQQWRFANAGNGNKWTITNVNSGKVLDATNCSWDNGTAVDLWSPLGNNCQQWAVIPTGGGRYEIVVENSGMVLDSVNCGKADGTRADLWQWINNTCQEWSITQ